MWQVYDFPVIHKNVLKNLKNINQGFKLEINTPFCK